MPPDRESPAALVAGVILFLVCVCGAFWLAELVR